MSNTDLPQALILYRVANKAFIVQVGQKEASKECMYAFPDFDGLVRFLANHFKEPDVGRRSREEGRPAPIKVVATLG